NFIANEICVHNSSDRPNFQNIPARDKEAMQITRGALFPREGHQLLEVDFKSLEVAIAACYNNDPTMLSYLREGGDMHKDVAEQIFFIKNLDKHSEPGSTLRKATKNSFVFPQFYGDYYKNNAEGFCEWLKLPKRKKFRGKGIQFNDEKTIGDHLAENGIKSFGKKKKNSRGRISVTGFMGHIKEIEEDFWTNRFPVYYKWREKWWEKYLENGYIDMYTGFRCKGVMGKNNALNAPIQGTAFHCLLWSFIKLDQILRSWNTKIVGQIHDSIILDVAPDELDQLIKLIKQITEVDLPKAWTWINVPLSVEFEMAGVDQSMAEMEEIEI
ncbi:MAG: DNA polymerase, partial [Bacteroidales bacterium]